MRRTLTGCFHNSVLDRCSAFQKAILGRAPSIGRTFSPNEDLAEQESEAVISFDFWQRRFSGESSVIGKSITLSGQSYTIIGVMPRQYRYAFLPCDVWVPATFSGRALRPEERHSRSLDVFVRLRQGVSAPKAQAELSTILQQAAPDDPEEKGWSAKLMTLQDRMVDENTRTSFALLMGLVGLILLIACANIGGMYLARSATRQQEFAIRHGEPLLTPLECYSLTLSRKLTFALSRLRGRAAAPLTSHGSFESGAFFL